MSFTYAIAVLDNTGSEIEEQTYLYEEIIGTFERQRNEVEILKYAGVTGVGLRDLGPRGREFTITAREFLLSVADAETAIATYQSLIGAGAPYGINVYQHSQLMGRFFVVEVAEAAPVKIVGRAVSRLVNGATVSLTTRWTLIHRPAS